MTGSAMLIAVTIALPLAMLALCLSRSLRARMPALLALAPIPALAAALFAMRDTQLDLPGALFGATLVLDAPGGMLLGAAAVLWIAAGAYAATYMRDKPNREAFASWWLLALTGNLGVFIAADVASFYLFYVMGSLAAYGLIVHDGTPNARRASFVYVGFALLGEACVLMALVLLAAANPYNTTLIGEAVAALSTSPWRDATLALFILGFGMKIALVPLHVWMPLAYTAAPIPAAAVMSGAAVKAGVIGLIRFIPFDTALPAFGGPLVVIGLFSALYGVAIGIRHSNPKKVLAYSSVSQMGTIAAVFGMGLAAANANVALAASFYAAHHMLVKAALFLAIGVVASGRSNFLHVGVPATVIALSLAGLPFTGGYLAKEAVKPMLGEGIVGFIAALASAGTALLMLHFLRCLPIKQAQVQRAVPPPGLMVPWFVMAVASIAVPWALYPLVLHADLSQTMTIKGLVNALWPVLLGVGLAAMLRSRLSQLQSSPASDAVPGLKSFARATALCGAACERADTALRQWPVAGVALLMLTISFATAMALVH